MSAAHLTPAECRRIFEQLAAYAESCAETLRTAVDSEAGADIEALADSAHRTTIIMGALADAAAVRCGGASRRAGGPLGWLAWPDVAEALQAAPQGAQA